MKREKKYTPSKTVLTAVAELVKEYAPLIPGCTSNLSEIQQYFRDSISADWSRSWTVGCSLYFVLHYKGREIKEDGTEVQTYDCAVNINWSATGRTPAAARAAIALYSAVTDLGAQIETMCDSFGYIGDVVATNPQAEGEEVTING
jgi:hypothetical protein